MFTVFLIVKACNLIGHPPRRCENIIIRKIYYPRCTLDVNFRHSKNEINKLFLQKFHPQTTIITYFPNKNTHL